MKIMSLMFVCGMALAACGGKQGGDTTTPDQNADTTDPNTSTSNTDPNAGDAEPTGEGIPCSQEIALECPEGQIDACLKQPPEGDTHTCVAQ